MKTKIEPDGGIYFLADAGDIGLCCITAATPKAAVEKFTELLTKRAAEWERIAQAIREIPPGPKTKCPEAFRQKERFVNELCKQAGIIDS